MRRISRLLLLLLLLPLQVLAVGEQTLLKDQPDQVNYSLGYQLGQQLKTANLPFAPDPLWQSLNEGLRNMTGNSTRDALSQLGYSLGREIATGSVEFRPQALWQGLYDLIDQTEPRLAASEMARLLAEYRGAAAPSPPPVAKTAHPESSQNPVPPIPPKYYRLPGDKFLDENKDKAGVITLASGLQYRILASGTGKSPEASDRVLVSYLGKTIEGKVFISSGPGGNLDPQEIVVNGVMPGVTQALQMMREGDKWEIVLPTRLAFKDTGPFAGQTIILELELLEILPRFY
jgi:hypothetical protein